MHKLRSKWQTSHTYWLFIFILCVVIQLFNLSGELRFDRQFIAQGQLWLLFSAHLTHLNWNHLGLNMAGLLLVVIFFSAYMSLLGWLILSLWSALIVSLGLYYFNPDIYWYVGLSGVLHALFVVGGGYEFRQYKASGGVLLILIVAKLIWEQWSGALPGSEAMTGGYVVVDAHLYGAIAGGVFWVVWGWIGGKFKLG